MMITGREVAARMDQIKEIFIQAQFVSASLENLDNLITKLDDFKAEYRLIAYEAAAMVLALKDLESGEMLTHWRSFTEKIKVPIIPHAHLGLGWAIARREANPTILKAIEPAMRFRVVDGWGYYDGTFRQRMTIKLKKTPENLDEKTLRIYDQGVGRSLWYGSQGRINLLKEMIESFATVRQIDLWRGVGIACSFVGGCDEDDLRTMAHVAAANQIQLGIGATMAAKARLQTDSPTQDTELACREWCNLSARKAMQLAVTNENNIEWKNDGWEDSYFLFITKIVNELSALNAPILEANLDS